MPPEYEIREHTRAKYVRITLYPDGRIVLTKPKRVSQARIARFVEGKREWIAATQAKIVRRVARARKLGPAIDIPKLRRGTTAHREAIEAARTLVHARLPELNAAYGFRYGRISIRDQKTRWGSCSAKGNLNFNYKIAFLPPDLADYLLVHELCHLRKMNHAPQFWALVEKRIPEYRTLRARLKAVPLG